MALIDLLFPRCCHLCGVTLPADRQMAKEPLCASCIANLPRTLYHRRKNNPMENRFAGIIPFERATGHFFYSSGSELSELMQDLKYRRFRNLARFMGELIGKELLSSGFLSDIDFVVPIPIHFLKKASRGYNQTEEMALGFSRATFLPIDTSLKAVRPHRTQTALSIEERRNNLRNVFKLTAPQNYHHQHILLLDDVCTTGSTLAAAAEAITTMASDVKVSFLTAGVTF